MPVIFLFIDGVGLGRSSEENPLLDEQRKSLAFMSEGQPLTEESKPVLKDNHFFKGVDATLGVEGLPQSGTGQTTLFSGHNAAKVIGKHFGPFPHSGIKYLLHEHSLFNKAQAQGKSCSFINGYPDIFFEKSEARNRWSCTTLMTKSAGIKLHTTRDVQEEQAITAGITQTAWRQHLSIDVPAISPQEAAFRLINQSVSYDLIMHEYYLTDKAGHGRTGGNTYNIIARYDQFLWTLIKNRPEQTTIVLCSDHGNVEDLSTKTHTRNNVPLFVFGPGAPAFHQAESIMDVTPGILRVLD